MNTELSLIRVALHGGAGELPAGNDTSEYRAALRTILADAHQRLRKGASALDAAEAAVVALEDCPLFNAGYGAVLNADGVPELDAAVMDGRDRSCGAVGAVIRDAFGQLAAATSTGGRTNKLAGRVGDSPIIGAGTFADNRSLAVSC